MFTDRELQLILNSVHERGIALLDIGNAMSQKGFRNRFGEEAAKEDIKNIYNGYKEHLDLAEKIKFIREPYGVKS